MEKEVIGTDDAPAAVGPYSQAIRIGELVFTSGQLGLIPGTRQFLGRDVEAQALQALRNLGAILEASGSSLRNVLKCTVYLRDMGEFPRVNEVYARLFDDKPPARSAVQVSGLPLDACIEIDAIALAENGSSD